MKADIHTLVHASPFEPFTSHWADGAQLRNSTIDHMAGPPAGGRNYVFGDDEHYDVISALMITRITVDREAASSNQTQ